MTNQVETFLYKHVSLWTGLIALIGTVVSVVWFQAGITKELALFNKKLDNHITHISDKVDENTDDIKIIQSVLEEIKIDIAKLR